MPLGLLIHKGYSSQYLAAHNCTTSGFLAAFKFWDFWVALHLSQFAVLQYIACEYAHTQLVKKLYFTLGLEDQEDFIGFSVIILHKIWVKYCSKYVFISTFKIFGVQKKCNFVQTFLMLYCA
jgi:hypothetical protein